MFHEFAPLIDPILKLNWLCCGIAKTTMCTSKIAHFALVQKLVVVMDERIVLSVQVPLVKVSSQALNVKNPPVFASWPTSEVYST